MLELSLLKIESPATATRHPEIRTIGVLGIQEQVRAK